jgi:hypothetical protein
MAGVMVVWMSELLEVEELKELKVDSPLLLLPEKFII